MARGRALYEAVYLRVFTAWENTLEDITVYYLAGYAAPSYTPSLMPGVIRSRTLTDARRVLFNGRPFLLWHSPQRVITRVSGFLVGCPIEAVLRANQVEIEDFAAIRHGIAHASPDAKAGVKSASLRRSGTEYATPGRFLRTARLEDPLNQTKWLLVARDRLLAFVTAMTA